MTPTHELLRLARAATQGNWGVSGVRQDASAHGHCIYAGPKQENIALVFYDKRTGEGFWDAKFVGATSPARVIALCEEVERLREALEAIRDISGAPSLKEPDYSRLDRIYDIARQALEQTHD